MSEVLELRQHTWRPGERDDLIEEADGVRVLGRFRDLDADDRFVWLRGFADLARAETGTTPDSDDVLLLQPSRTPLDPIEGALVTVTLYHLPPGGADKFLAFFDAEVRPLLVDTGAPPLAVLRTLHDARPVVAWLASFPGADQLRDHIRWLGAEPRWTHDVLPALTRRLARPPEQLQLAPVGRSALR